MVVGCKPLVVLYRLERSGVPLLGLLATLELVATCPCLALSLLVVVVFTQQLQVPQVMIVVVDPVVDV